MNRTQHFLFALLLLITINKQKRNAYNRNYLISKYTYHEYTIKGITSKSFIEFQHFWSVNFRFISFLFYSRYGLSRSIPLVPLKWLNCLKPLIDSNIFRTSYHATGHRANNKNMDSNQKMKLFIDFGPTC